MANNKDDVVAGLIGAATIAATTYVGYKIFKAVTNRAEAPSPTPVVASTHTPRTESSYSSYNECKHGNNPASCMEGFCY